MTHIRRFQWILYLALPAVAFAQSAPSTETAQLTVVTDRPDALYHAGDPVTFKITLQRPPDTGEPGPITYTLSNDGEGKITEGKLKPAAEPQTVTGTLHHPGFLRCDVMWKPPKGKPVSARAGAGLDPLKIPPSMPAPDDFDAFWAKQKRKLAEVPMTPKLTSVPSPGNDIECFDLQVPCLGPTPVSGYFVRPTNAKPKSLPAILSVHGAGVRNSNLGQAVQDARRGAIAMDINAHGLPNGRPKKFYEQLSNTELKEYRTRGRESRETCYFLGMYLRLIRAMDFLTHQPEWDGRTLIVHGSSQGGGQSIVAAGLEPRVTLFCANVPAMCDHTATVNGWPRLVPRGPDGKPDPKILDVARYFDAMNFASRTRAEALVSVGFIDDTCRPSSVYAAYNNLKGPKRIINEPMMPHASWPNFKNAEAEMISAHLKRAKP